MKISIISGSHRNPSQSEKVARHIEQTLQAEHPGTGTWLYTLSLIHISEPTRQLMSSRMPSSA